MIITDLLFCLAINYLLLQEVVDQNKSLIAAAYLIFKMMK